MARMTPNRQASALTVAIGAPSAEPFYLISAVAAVMRGMSPLMDKAETIFRAGGQRAGGQAHLFWNSRAGSGTLPERLGRGHRMDRRTE
jgi:hypothetical protein